MSVLRNPYELDTAVPTLGGMVVQQVAVPSHIPRVPGSILAYATVWSFCVKFLCEVSVHILFVFFFHLPENMPVGGFSNTKLPLGVNECVCVHSVLRCTSKGYSDLAIIIKLCIHRHAEAVTEDECTYIVGTRERTTVPAPKPQWKCCNKCKNSPNVIICGRIHSFSPWDSFSMSHELQNRFSVTTNSKLVLSNLLAWINLWSISISEICLLLI